jgi:hypothetical protein
MYLNSINIKFIVKKKKMKMKKSLEKKRGCLSGSVPSLAWLAWAGEPTTWVNAN